MAARSGDRSLVPDLVGLTVIEARDIARAAALFVTAGDPDGPPLRVPGWPSRSVVIAQDPRAGLQVERGSWIVIEVWYPGGGDGAGDREPRIPDPPAGTIAVRRTPSP